MASYILGTWYLWVKMEVNCELTGTASKCQVLRYTQCLNETLRHRRQQFEQKLQHLWASLLFKKAKIVCTFGHLCCTQCHTCSVFTDELERWLLWVLILSLWQSVKGLDKSTRSGNPDTHCMWAEDTLQSVLMLGKICKWNIELVLALKYWKSDSRPKTISVQL